MPDIPPPPPLGDLPPWRTSIPIIVAVFSILILLGFLAEALHRSMPPR
jgi:hypothetical protein